MNPLADFLGKFHPPALISMAAACAIVGDYFAKLWSINQKDIYYFLAVFTYAGSGVFFTPSLLRKGLLVGSLIWTLLTVIGFVFIGIVLFNEKLTLMQLIGAVFGLIALIILNVY